MAFAHAEADTLIPLKVLIAGGFGVGKTTLVRSLSEIPPLLTEQEMTSASVGVDDAEMVPDKRTTTVAMDFGRITVDDCFPAIDYFENRGMPFVIAVNRFPGADEHDIDTVRDALAVSDDCPVIWMDARDSRSSQDTLVVLVEHALERTVVTT